METIILIGVILLAFVIGFLIGCMVCTPKKEVASRFEPDMDKYRRSDESDLDMCRRVEKSLMEAADTVVPKVKYNDNQ